MELLEFIALIKSHILFELIQFVRYLTLLLRYVSVPWQIFFLIIIFSKSFNRSHVDEMLPEDKQGEKPTSLRGRIKKYIKGFEGKGKKNAFQH